MSGFFCKIKAAALSVLICAGLCGCEIGTPADSLLLPPMISSEQEEVYNALEESAGKDISLVYPRSGVIRSAFVFYDLDGDGGSEAVVFYENKKDPEARVRVNILDSQDGWHSVYDHAGAGSYVEQVFFTDLGGLGKARMAIGYGSITPTEKTLRVYSFDNGALVTEYSESYYKTLCLDLDRDEGEDIAVINCNNEYHGAYMSLVTDRGSGAECTSTVDLSPNTADLPSVIAGYIGGNTPAVFADGLNGNGNISTEIIYCVNGQLRNPANLTGSDIPALTQRAQGLYCQDVDGDLVVEIPSTELFEGYRNETGAEYITNWNVFENYTVKEKYSSLTESDKGYCFMLPVRWEGLVTVKTDSVTGEKVFYKFNSSLSQSRLELMRILVCAPSEAADKSLEGYAAISSAESAVYMVKFGQTEDNLLLTMAEVSNNFFLI